MLIVLDEFQQNFYVFIPYVSDISGECATGIDGTDGSLYNTAFMLVFDESMNNLQSST